MDIWFLSNQNRLSEERHAIQKLEKEAEWLQGTEWLLTPELALNATIVAHGHTYNVQMTYPKHFPFTPPIVRPIEPNTRWSQHQYADGTLCLEWGPDTWVSEVTGAEVLASVYRLLDIENPLGSEAPRVAPSRHFLTQGQELRRTVERLYVSKSLCSYLESLPAMTTGTMDLSFHIQRDSCTVLLQELRPVQGTAWSDAQIPNALCGKKGDGLFLRGLFFIADLSAQRMNQLSTLQDIEILLRSGGYGEVSLSDLDRIKGLGLEKAPDAILLTDESRQPHMFSVFGHDPVRVYRASNVLETENATVPRTPVDLEQLAEKKIAVVGLGSLGSKVAISLTRMGAKKFFLVDDDVLLPENLCRHALDWRSVGCHKASAIARSIEQIGSKTEVEISRINLTGQENPATLSGVLARLARCDLVLDMTANSQVFNLLTGACQQSSTLLVWAEVFAGGIGGLVARSRPQKDPSPQVIRAAFLRYTEENPFPESSSPLPYTLENLEGNVMVASDADVAVIAGHTADIAADAVLKREPSKYPYSLYLIGLTRSWIFEAPFHTIPIATDQFLDQEGNSNLPSTPVLEDNVSFIRELLEKSSDMDSPSE
jgi:molybdopterin/thiamine biosynthesis adenylyltransferase/ubiquitin-protein ligase